MLLSTRGIVDEGATELVRIIMLIACRHLALLTLYVIYKLLKAVARLVCIDAYSAETSGLPCAKQVHLLF